MSAPAWLPVGVLAAPLLAAVIGLLTPLRRPGLAHTLAALVMAAGTVLAVWMAGPVLADGGMVQGPRLPWLDLGPLGLGLGVAVDPMGAVLAVIVGVLATLVLVFNAWYMHDDPLAGRFPWQFTLFAFAMQVVVLADNLFMAFIGWELVGLGSFLLIGFWAHRPAAALDPDYQRLKHPAARGVLEDRLSPGHAQLKAFVMNRVGDAGFLIGIAALLAAGLAAGVHEPLRWGAIQAMAADGALDGTFLGLSGHALLTLAALGILCGAIGKSAQFPLHTWLPDAMQGPTTASSIIHAATMVAAGVFLTARCLPAFTPEALTVVGWTGGITCLLAASIACVQWDLKAVLAYSTVSQLGLMFAALGAGEESGGRAAAISHLATHALFKNLLFLCAGAVIHACGGCQDLHRLGGLRRPMPVTALCAGLAVLAIIGAPFFSGFLSKDAVLAATLLHAEHAGGAAWGPFLLVAAGSLLTAGYMVRWWWRIFAGHGRDHATCHHAHDPAPAARAVLLILAPATVLYAWNWWLPGVLGAPEGEAHAHAHHTAMALAGAMLATGAGTALVLFAWRPALAEAAARRLRWLHTGAAELWGIDRLWDLLFVRGAGAGLGRLAARLDLGSPARLEGVEQGGGRWGWTSLDGLVDGLGRSLAALGRLLGLLHRGHLGAAIAVALIAALAWLLWGLA